MGLCVIHVLTTLSQTESSILQQKNIYRYNELLNLTTILKVKHQLLFS